MLVCHYSNNLYPLAETMVSSNPVQNIYIIYTAVITIVMYGTVFGYVLYSSDYLHRVFEPISYSWRFIHNIWNLSTIKNRARKENFRETEKRKTNHTLEYAWLNKSMKEGCSPSTALWIRVGQKCWNARLPTKFPKGSHFLMPSTASPLHTLQEVV